MPTDHETRRYWRLRWLSSIQEYSDDHTQHRLWLDTTNINPHWTFFELNSCYFDDLNLGDGGGYSWAVDDGLVSSQEALALGDFHAAAAAYRSPTDDFDHPTILADQKWHEVVAKARWVQHMLLDLINDEEERDALTKQPVA